ncbi:hypothetical protein DKX38_002553 [Salix brachista]|uniref:MHD domain-containing protein n=1 Tax=Salix brachista TaxID=2182728 RepID=A0A5N5NME4_9ROSI|nr:hypothetical protein DKX38_002553 [Salix brachista]
MSKKDGGVDCFDQINEAEVSDFQEAQILVNSRECPANILGFQPGEAFMGRNVANHNGPTETNYALEFAVNTVEFQLQKVHWFKRALHEFCRGRSVITKKQTDRAKKRNHDLSILRALAARRQYCLSRLQISIISDRGEVQKGSAEIFFRKVKFWKEDGEEEAPPVFVGILFANVDGVNYFHVKVVGLLFVATTRANVSPSLVLELLQRIARVIKDYLGVLNEDSLRKNFVLVYELLDEVIDFGYVQTTSTELLKSYVFNEPLVVDAARLQPLSPAAIFMQGTKRMPGTAVTKSVVANEPGGRKREEIFVDIIEKISVTFSSSGYILTSEIDGTIQMKSYLSGNPEIKLALNEDLSIGRGDYRSSFGSGAVILDDCNFHESVRLDNFDLDRTLTLVPPDGEFPVMNYRMTQEFKPPFRINTLIEEAGALKAEVILKVSAEFPSSVTANTIIVQMPLPKYTTRVNFELEPGALGQTTDFKEANRRLEWALKKATFLKFHFDFITFSFQSNDHELHGNITKEAGPVSMTFTIPMYNASRLQVKYLQIAKKSSTYNPYRWVRYVTQANSYVARI